MGVHFVELFRFFLFLYIWFHPELHRKSVRSNQFIVEAIFHALPHVFRLNYIIAPFFFCIGYHHSCVIDIIYLLADYRVKS